MQNARPIRRTIASAFTLLTLSSSIAFSDVVIDLHTKAANPTTQPAAGESAASVLAVPDHDFDTKVQMAGRSVELSGKVHALGDSKYRVRIEYVDRDGGSTQSVSTTVEVKAGEQFELAGSSQHKIVFSVRPS